MPHILLGEPDRELSAYLRTHLEVEGHTVEELPAGRALVERLASAAGPARAVDLAAFCLQLPDVHGFHVIRDLRAAGVGTAIVVTSECADEAHRVRGLRLGADDFLVKPFGVTEFLARVEAVLRRTCQAPGAARARSATGPAVGREGRVLRFGDVAVDTAARVVARRGTAVSLVPKEYDLLLALALRDGAVASRAALLAEVWGYDHSVTSRTVDGHIAGLRQKLEDDPRAPRHIITVYKAGYRLQR
jgi:DNA-binding response OmpR family regulator